MAKFCFGVLFMFCFVTNFCKAQDYIFNGNDLMNACESVQSTSNMLCVAYISGFIAGIQRQKLMIGQDTIDKIFKNTESEKFFCIKGGSSVEQMIDIVKKQLRNNPEVRHNRADELLFAIFMTVFPCE